MISVHVIVVWKQCRILFQKPCKDIHSNNKSFTVCTSDLQYIQRFSVFFFHLNSFSPVASMLLIILYLKSLFFYFQICIHFIFIYMTIVNVIVKIIRPLSNCFGLKGKLFQYFRIEPLTCFTINIYIIVTKNYNQLV